MSSLASFGSHFYSEMSLFQIMIDQLTCSADNTALKNTDPLLSWGSGRLKLSSRSREWLSVPDSLSISQPHLPDASMTG